MKHANMETARSIQGPLACSPSYLMLVALRSMSRSYMDQVFHAYETKVNFLSLKYDKSCNIPPVFTSKWWCVKSYLKQATSFKLLIWDHHQSHQMLSNALLKHWLGQSSKWMHFQYLAMYLSPDLILNRLKSNEEWLVFLLSNYCTIIDATTGI